MSVDQEAVSLLFRKLGRELSKLASKPQPKNVHQFRTTTRRVEAVVEELVPQQDHSLRKLMKQLGKLRKRAGRVRDMDVLISNLRNLKVSEEPGRKSELLRSLAELRSRREEKLIDGLDKQKVRSIQKRIKRAAASLTLRDGDLAGLATRMFSDLARANENLNADVLHQYRIRGKRIRYIAEVAGDTPETQRIVSELKRMQDAIGEWHDWLTLSEKAERLGTDERPSALLAALKNITRAKYRDAIQVVSETKNTLLPRSIDSSKAPMRAGAGRKPSTPAAVASAAVA
jgi:CHAD domain-containing protein